MTSFSSSPTWLSTAIARIEADFQRSAAQQQMERRLHAVTV